MTGPLCDKCFTQQDQYGNVWVCTLCISEDDTKDLRRQIAKIEKFHLRQIERGMGPGLKCRNCSDLIEWDEGTMSPPDYCEVCFKLRRLETLEARITDTLTLLEKGIDCGTGELWIEGHDGWDREQFLEALKGILMGENKE